MNKKIVEEIQRPDEEIINSIEGHSSADVHEAMGKTKALAPEINLRTSGVPICGPAVTVDLPIGDNLMVHVGSRVANEGDVLVISAGTDRGATWGELATRNAIRKGLKGVVSSGNIRDIEAVSNLEFPVFSSSVSQIGAVKETSGSVNIPVSIGGVIVNPGDLIVGDRDGVTVIPKEEAENVLKQSEDHLDKENEIRERIESGESLYEIKNYDDIIMSEGLQSLLDGD